MSTRLASFALAAALLVLPAGAAPAAATTLPLTGVIIALDPGHNGGNASYPSLISKLVFIGNGWKACNTVGTTTRTGYPEHRFNYYVALRVKARLEALGATVAMTRTSDTGVGPCVDVRGKFGAKVHAALLLSIHGDGAPIAYHGFTVMRPGLVAGYTDDIVTSSARLAYNVRDGLKASGYTVANYYGTNGLKVRTDLGTLNMSDVPAIMVELGNMKNSTDAGRMTTWSGRDHYAAALVGGLRRFLGR
ncbi:MAG TPA: N-acetylmuramoyl-L-alanine amidase [Candidatus Limnocylindrales bacterium]|nr:N-acetylmuramoyl-L-alanine amidase [Candidatus Limnocylindrales bacterium]